MTKFANLKVGEKLSELQYYTVDKITGNEVDLKLENGQIATVDSKYAEACLISASQVETEVNINRTDAINLLTASANLAMTVNFNTKVDPKEITAAKKKLTDLAEGKITMTKKEIVDLVDSITEGKDRTMVGRHSGEFNEFGRLKFIDMQAGSGFNFRQVDPRTVNWMIIKGIKYNVGK
jgi:hypothetical protein